MLNHKELKAYFRDSFVNFTDASISIATTGFIYGLAVFTGMRAHFNTDTQVLYLFRPEDHYKRLRQAAKLCHFENFSEQYPYDKWLGIITELLRTNNIKQDIYIRATIFSDQESITPKFMYQDSFCAFLYALGNYVPTTGMKCMVSSWTRIEDNAIPARPKLHGAYVNSAFAKTQALKLGFDEAIVLDNRGHVVEGSAENIFVVYQNVLYTPPVTDNILEGITRATVMQLARDEGYDVVERSIDRTELYRADEVFLTGTGAQVSPVVLIDSYTIGTGEVGPVAKRLQNKYHNVVRGADPRYTRWVVKI